MSEQKNVKYKYSGDADKLGYIAQLTADNARLRKAIEDVPMCRSNAAFPSKEAAIQSHNLRLFEWKRNALEGK